MNTFLTYKSKIEALLAESRRRPGSLPEGDKAYLYVLRLAHGRGDARSASKWWTCLSKATRDVLGPPPLRRSAAGRPQRPSNP